MKQTLNGSNRKHAAVARALATIVAMIALAFGGARAQAQDGGGAGPCPSIELLCGDYTPPTDPSEDACYCGPGGWNRRRLDGVYTPIPPVDETRAIRRGFTDFLLHREASATPMILHAALNLNAKSHLWDAGSQTAQVRATCRDGWKEGWSGSLPACARPVLLAATGAGAITIGVSCTARAGCSAHASASVNGAAASRGNASANFAESLHASAAHTSGSNSVSVEGSIGASVDIVSPTIEGSYSREDRWSTQGIGSATGTLAFTVKPDRTYCALTNLPFTVQWSGAVAVAVAASVDENGSSSASAGGSLSIGVQ